ncbi:MAG: hypothetical protein H8E66_23090 [Planctomycetes bacterium]|nr:hypothetical protein [Planctomycetota bacterium]
MNKYKKRSEGRCSFRRRLYLESLEDRAFLAVLSVGPAEAFQTIQSAIDNARRDDVVEVADGIYDEAVDLSRMGSAVGAQPTDLILRGESENTILRAPVGSAISNTSSISGELTIEGFTIESPADDPSSHGIELSGITGTLLIRAMTFQNISASALSLDTITGDIAVRANDFLGTGRTDGTNAILVRDLSGIGVISQNQLIDVFGNAIRVEQSGGTETLILISDNLVRGDSSFLATTQNGFIGTISNDARLDLSLNRNTFENLGGRAIDVHSMGPAELQTRWTRNVVSQLGGDTAFLLTVAGTSNTALGAVNNSILDTANDGMRVVLNDSARLAAVVQDNLLLGTGDAETDVGLRFITGASASGELAASISSNDFDTISGDGLLVAPGSSVDATLAVLDNFFTGTNSVGGDAALVIRNENPNATNSIRAVISENRLQDGSADAYQLQQQGGSLVIEGDAATASEEIEATNTGQGISIQGGVTLIPLGSLTSATPRLLGDFVWSDDNADGLQDVGEPGIELILMSLTGNEQLGGAAINRQTLTSSDGAYLFSAVLPGVYTLSLVPPTGFVPTEPLIGNDTQIDSDVDAITAFAQVTIDDSDNLSVDVGLVTGFPWQNSDNFLDVNADTVVAPIDVLQIINELNSFGPHALAFPTSEVAPAPFFDVNGDDFVSPVDALQIINFLNGASAEAESPTDSRVLSPYVIEPWQSKRWKATGSRKDAVQLAPVPSLESHFSIPVRTPIPASRAESDIRLSKVEPLLESLALEQLRQSLS